MMSPIGDGRTEEVNKNVKIQSSTKNLTERVRRRIVKTLFKMYSHCPLAPYGTDVPE